MRFLGSPWPCISAALRKAKTRTAVTAYLTSSALQMLPLKGKRDRLIVDASDATVAAGLTDPHVIEKFMKARVRCYSVAGLHAKVYIADGVMFCGSANATSNSRSEALEEACLQVKNATMIAEFEEWLGGLRLERLDDERIEDLKAKYKPAKWHPGRRSGKKASRARSWLTWTVPSKQESEAIENYVESVSADEGMDPGDVEWIEISARRKPGKMFEEARKGDELFVLHHEKGTKRFYEPVRVVAPAKVVEDRRILLHESSGRSVALNRALRAAKLAGLNLPESGKSQRVLSPQSASALRRMFSTNGKG